MGWLWNSIELAQESHVYSYRHGFRGFAAKLTEDQAFQISSEHLSFQNPLFSRQESGTNCSVNDNLNSDTGSGFGVSQFEKKATHHSFVGFHGSCGRGNHGDSWVLHQEPSQRYCWFH